MDYDQLQRSALIKLLQEHDEALTAAGKDGIVMNYTGRAAPWQITRLVKPKLSRIDSKFSLGDEVDQSLNEIWDGENLSAMVTLYRHRGQVDLVVADPPYNTGEDFRYNDKWDKDPNDPDLGELVPKDDGSRHSKWLKFMTPRVWMMREMLRPGGVLAICIDHRELYRLGMLMDEIFGEDNRLAIINWQKAYSTKRTNHVATATEYVLVYAKDQKLAKTALLERSDAMNARFTNEDGDPDGPWRPADLAAQEKRERTIYAIQSPFTGKLHYPEAEHRFGEPVSIPTRHWSGLSKKEIKGLLERWGSSYVEKDLGDDRGKALILKGSAVALSDYDPQSDNVIQGARKRALKLYEKGLKGEACLPRLLFSDDRQKNVGAGRPAVKRHLKHISQGKIPWTFWADEDYDTPVDLGTVSWEHAESGHSQAGINELNAVIGKGHGFQTVKPLKLVKKIIQLWCKPDGLVLDPFAGSGTTGEAVLELNRDTGAGRRFILIEQGNTEKGDHYARTLTAERVRRVITGQWAAGARMPTGGGFRFVELGREKIDADAVNALAREEMIDLLLTSYWDKSEKAKSYLQRFPIGAHKLLFAVNLKNEGFFLVWDAPDGSSVLDRTIFRQVVNEAEEAGLAKRYHVYASFAPYTGVGIEFYKIPDKVLEHIGFNPRSDAYNNISDAA